MDYTFEIRLSTEKPIVREYVQMMVEKAVREINVSPIMGAKETPLNVEVTAKSKK